MKHDLPILKHPVMLALFGYVALAVIMTWPAILRFTTAIVGGHDDLWIHQWTFWWIKEALQKGYNPFYTDYLYFPNGVTLTSHNIAWFNIAVWLPLQAFIGQIPAYGLLLIATFAVNGFALYLFARKLIGNEWPAFLSGVIFAFWPYTMSHNDHPNMIVLFWLPLTLLSLTKLFESQRWRDVLFTAVSLALLGISRWQVLLMSLPLLIIYGSYLLVTRLRTDHPDETGSYWSRNRKLLGKVGLAVLLAALLMLPLGAPLVVYQVTREHPEDLAIDEPAEYRTDLLAYVTPLFTNSLWGEHFVSTYQGYYSNPYYIPFLGFTTLLLVTVGLFLRWRQTRLWLLIMLFYLLFALGDFLSINGKIISSIPLPYGWFQDTTIFQLIRRPHRLNLVLSLPVSLIAGWGFFAISQWLHDRPRLNKVIVRLPRNLRISSLLPAVFISLILLEYAVIPFPTTTPSTPAFYQALANDKEEYGVIDIPVNNHAYNKWYMFYQITHGKKMMTGHVSRLPRDALNFLSSVPFLRATIENDNVINPSEPDLGRQLRQLADANVRYIVIHKQFAHEGVLTLWRDWMTVEPFYEDDEVVVYTTDPNVKPASLLSEDIGILRLQFQPQESVQGGFIEINATWGSVKVPDHDYWVCFNLSSQTDHHELQHCSPLSDDLPTSQWQQNDIVRATYLFPNLVDLPPGSYELSVNLENEDERVLLGSVLLQPYSPQNVTDVRFGESIRLKGYDVTPEAGKIAIALYWQADAPISQSYKYFVHLVDAASGELVNQLDAVPRNWTYPTTRWKPGEVIYDTLTLETSGLSNYEVWLGLYDAQSGVRLTLPHGTAARPDALKIFPVDK